MATSGKRGRSPQRGRDTEFAKHPVTLMTQSEEWRYCRDSAPQRCFEGSSCTALDNQSPPKNEIIILPWESGSDERSQRGESNGTKTNQFHRAVCPEIGIFKWVVEILAGSLYFTQKSWENMHWRTLDETILSPQRSRKFNKSFLSKIFPKFGL